MKSENTIMEELTFPSNYISSQRDVLAFIEKAFQDGVFFKNKVYAAVQGSQMFLILDGISFPLMESAAVIDSRDRMTGDQAEVINDPATIKRLIQSFDNKTKALYWWLLVKYAETTIIKSQAATSLYAIIGENGIVDSIMNPPPSYMSEFVHSEDEDDDDDDDDDDYDDDYE